MNTKNQISDGGPAFPILRSDQAGMSLRDWFAGQVLNGLYSVEDQRSMPMDKTPEEREEEYTKWAKADAKWSYRLADAMLAARNNTKP